MSDPSEPLLPHAHLVRGLAPDSRYRFVATVCTKAAAEAAERCRADGLVAVALGRAVAAGLCMASLTKGDERVIIQWHGDGPLSQTVVEARDSGDVRGYVRGKLVRWEGLRDADERPRASEVIGQGGMLTVIRELGLRQDYMGQLELKDGEIDSDLESYLNQSEQVDSALACEVLLDEQGHITLAAGLLIQAMPGAAEEALVSVRERIQRGELWQLLRSQGGAIDAAMMVAAVVPEGMARIMWSSAVRFHCPCDAERVSAALTTLGPADLDALVEEQGGAQISCQFCGEQYQLSAEDLQGLAADLRRSLN